MRQRAGGSEACRAFVPCICSRTYIRSSYNNIAHTMQHFTRTVWQSGRPTGATDEASPTSRGGPFVCARPSNYRRYAGTSPKS